MNIYEEVEKGTFLEAARTGSRYICDPPVLDTDDDYIVLVDDLAESIEKFLYQDGWKRSGAESYPVGGNWESIKKTFNGTVINLIMTDDENFFNRFVHATETAKKLNLLKKEDRIVLFQAIVEAMPTHEDVDLPETEQAEQVSFNFDLETTGYASDVVSPRPSRRYVSEWINLSPEPQVTQSGAVAQGETYNTAIHEALDRSAIASARLAELRRSLASHATSYRTTVINADRITDDERDF